MREVYEFGDFRLDAARRLLTRADESVPLTSKSFETLVALMRNRDRVLTKDELMKAVWPDSFVEEVNLAQNVSALRKALGEQPGENRFIATVPGKGYRFVGEAREVGGAEGDLVVERHTRAQVVVVEEEDGAELVEGQIANRTLALPATKSISSWRLGAALVLLVALAVGTVYWMRFGRPGSANETSHSLVVLPFQPLAGADEEHLGLGVADAVITKLSNLRELPVRPTDVAMRYAEAGTDPIQAARELKVDTVLSGKIQKAGNRLRVTVQLLRVSDGRPIWAQTFDEDYTNIFAVEDSISEKVVEALALKLGVDEKRELSRHATENIDAYRNYLEGRYAAFTFTREGLNKAIDYFNRAIAIDPGYALAYAGLADAYTTASDWLLAPADALPKADAAARKALTFDPNLAEAHSALAHALLHEWKLPESEREFHRALELNPQSVSTYFAYGEYLASTGRPDLTIAETPKALAIDPLSPEINSFVAWDYYLERDYAGCLSASQKAMQMFPGFWVPNMIDAMCLYMRSDFAGAIGEYQKALAMNPDSTFSQAGVAMSLARSGKRAEALKALDKLKGMASRTYVSPFYVGLVYMALGDRDQEFAWYEKGYGDRSEWLLWLPIDPMFDGERKDPRYLELVRKVRATQ